MIRLDNAAARRLFLQVHGLAEPPTGPGRGDDLLQVIHRLGFVQVDSVRTVERPHHMILFARRQRYRPSHLAPLMERDRALFEHWTHDAALLPIAFYPYWRLRFARDAVRLSARWQSRRRAGFAARCDDVLAHIRDHGPAGSADIGPDEPKAPGGWWDWHPSKTALEYLWRSGTLAVARRDNFRKIYDRAERVIPSAMLQPVPSEAETANWLNHAALTRLGFATPGEIAAFWDTLRPAEVRAWCDARLRDGTLAPLAVEGADGHWRHGVGFADVAEQANAAPEPPGRLRALSPFDPMLRDRARAERLFGFRYRIEIFTPAAQRVYGDYVFPLLEGARMVGRIDMSADRKAGVLAITALWPEPGVRWGGGRQARLEAELDRVARFAGLESIQWRRGWLRETKAARP